MKKSFLVLLLSLTAFVEVWSQELKREPTALRFPSLPPFTLIAPDSSSFTRENLAKNRKTLIMYFSPDCDHCKRQTEDMLKKMDRLKDVQILMTTYQPFEEMVAFYRSRNLAAFPNIKMGRDSRFFFVPFYEIRDLPYLALYDARGSLVKTFEGTTPVEKIVSAFANKQKKKG